MTLTLTLTLLSPNLTPNPKSNPHPHPHPRRYEPSKLVHAVQTLEEPSLYWRDLLAQAGAKHHEVLYESLHGASRAQAFQSAVTYIGGPPHARLREAHKEMASGSKQNLTLRVHPITCEERIQDWSKLKLLLKSDSLTLMTCELLASLARNQSIAHDATHTTNR